MSDVGETLRERRMALKIDVHEVEDATKIRSKYLRALENEEYDLLPGNAYVKSFLRTYADYLGLDSRALLNEYRLRHADDEDAIVPVSGGDGSSRMPKLWMLAAAALVVLLFVLFLVGALGGSGGG